MIRDIWEFYEQVDDLVNTWKEGKFKDFGERLKKAKSYNFSASEILGEISLVLKDFQSNQEATSQFEDKLIELLEFINLTHK